MKGEFSALADANDLKQLVHMCLSLIVSRYHVHSVHLLFRGSELHAERLVLVGAALDSASQRFRYATMAGLIGQAFRDNEVLNIPDVTKNERYVCGDKRTRAEAVAPITASNGVVLGVLNVESTKLSCFEPKDVDFIKEVARNVAYWLETHGLIKIDATYLPYWEVSLG